MAFDKLVRNVWQQKDKPRYSYGYFEATASIMRNALYRGWQGDDKLKLSLADIPTLDIDPNSDDWRVIANMEANLFRFSSAKTLDTVNKLNAALPGSKTFAEFKKNTEGIANMVNEDHLRTEYNFAWQTAQNAAEYQRMVEEKNEYPYWVYRTARDSRVRPAHRALEGKVFEADDPAFSIIYPPNGWGCRCYVEPQRENNSPELFNKQKAIEVLSSTIINDEGTTEYDRMKQDGMNVNRAKLGVVFDLNKDYADALGAKLGIKDNGVEPFKAMKNLPKLNAQQRNAEDAKTWFKNNVKNNIITDYAGRPIEFTEKTVTSHTVKPKYVQQNRAGLLELIPNILLNPEEVWLNQSSGNTYQYGYIKMFEDAPMIIVVSVEKNIKAKLETWYLLTKQPDDQRTGILIKKKDK